MPTPDKGVGLTFLSVAGGLVAVITIALVAASGGELLRGERDPGEHLTGILRAAQGITAVLCGQAVIHNGHDQLSVPLKTDDGELPQSDKHPPAVTGKYQILIKHGADGTRNLDGCLAAAAVTYVLDLGAEHHRIQHLHHSSGTVGMDCCRPIGLTDTGIAAVDVCAAVLAAQNCPLGEYRKSVQRCRTGRSHHRIRKDSVIEGHINAVMVSVEGHRLHECLVRLEKSRCRIEITIDVSKLVLEPGFEMSNRNIKAYIEDKYGFKVHDQYIAQIRGKLGLKYHEGYNKTEVHTRKITICPEYKETAIMDALEYFGCV